MTELGVGGLGAGSVSKLGWIFLGGGEVMFSHFSLSWFLALESGPTPPTADKVQRNCGRREKPSCGVSRWGNTSAVFF